MNMKDTLGLLFSGLMPCQCIKLTYPGIVLPMWSARARENVPCFIAFLTMAVTIAMVINPMTAGWNIFRMVEMVCSITATMDQF